MPSSPDSSSDSSTGSPGNHGNHYSDGPNPEIESCLPGVVSKRTHASKFIILGKHLKCASYDKFVFLL